MTLRSLGPAAAVSLLLLAACRDDADPSTSGTAADAVVGSADAAEAPPKDTLGAIGAPSQRFFVRVDGSHFTRDGAPLLAPTGDGGVVAAAAIRGETYDDQELWVGRFDRAGKPLWHSVREGPRKVGEGVASIRVAGDLAIVLATETAWPTWPPPSFLRALSLPTGDLVWEEACDAQTAPSCSWTDLELDSAGDLVVTGPAGDAAAPTIAVHRYDTAGAPQGTVVLGLDGAFLDLAVGPQGSWFVLGVSRETPTAPFVQAYDGVGSDPGRASWRAEVGGLADGESLVGGRLATALDGRLAITGAARDRFNKGFGVVLSASGEALFALPSTGVAHGPAAFGPGGDLYVASIEKSDLGGDLPGDYGERYAIRRTRFDREGAVRWSEQRQIQEHWLDSSQEIASDLVADTDGVFVGSGGPSEKLRDSDAYLERLDWASPLPPPPAEPLPYGVPTTLFVDEPPAAIGPRGAPLCDDDPVCPDDCATVCGVPLRIDALPGLWGFTATTASVPSGDPAALVADGSNSTWFRDTPGGPWTTVWARSVRVTPSGLAVFAQGEEQLVVLDAADPQAPVARACIAPPPGLGWHPTFTLGERWLVARTTGSVVSEGEESPEPGLYVYDLASQEPALGARKLPLAPSSAPVLDGDRLLVTDLSRLRLYDLAPQVIAPHADVALTGQFYNPVAIAGFALANSRAFDLRSSALDEYVATPRDCGWDLTRDGGGFSVVAGNPARLALGAALDCPGEWGGAVVADPAGDRIATQKGGVVTIRRDAAVERELELAARLGAWVDGRLIAYPEQACDFGCVGRVEVWSPETGQKTGELTEPASVLYRAADPTALYWLTYLDGVYASDDFQEPAPKDRRLRRVRASTLAVETLPLPVGLEVHSVAAAAGLLYVTTGDSRVLRLALDGIVLAEASLPAPISRNSPLAAAGLGLLVQTDRGQWFWFTEDLSQRRATDGCFSPTPLGVVGSTVLGVRAIPSPAFWGAWALEAWRLRPTSEQGFDIDVVGQWAERSYQLALGPDRLWVQTDRLFALLPPAE